MVSAHYASVALPAGDREAQRRAQDAANNALLLERLQGASRPPRALRQHAGGAALAPTTPSRWWPSAAGRARSSRRRAATGGFGYDPLMFIPALGRTVAELTPTLKNAHSHRALAARADAGS